MPTSKEQFKINSTKGFIYEVTLEHKPHQGISTAYYQDSIIAQVELNRLSFPVGDNDKEHEWYEERFAEWTDEVKVNIQTCCVQHFDQLEKK